MTPLQGEPPKIDFKLPKKFKRWLLKFVQFCVEIQPLNGFGLTINATPKGRLLKSTAQDAEPVQPNFRELDIRASGNKKVQIFNGTLFGSLPTGFSANDDPIFELTNLSDGDKIYAAITWDRRVLANGDIVGTITARTIEKSATVPTNNPLTSTRYYELASVTLGAGNVPPVVNQTRWGPIDDLPGTAVSNYYMPPLGTETTAQTDCWDLLSTGKGNDTGAVNLAPTYDSVQTMSSGLSRFLRTGDNLKIFVRKITVNSIGQITYIGDETLVFDQDVVNP